MSRGYAAANREFRLHQRKRRGSQERVLARTMELERDGIARAEAAARAMAEETGAPVEVCRKQLAEWQTQYDSGKPPPKESKAWWLWRFWAALRAWLAPVSSPGTGG